MPQSNLSFEQRNLHGPVTSTSKNCILPLVSSEYPVIIISDSDSEVVVEYSQKDNPSPLFGMQVIIPDTDSEEERKPTEDDLLVSSYRDMVPDVVSEIPYDIDGPSWYMIDVPEEDTFFSKYRYGRYFQLHTPRKKGFNGIKRLGKCRGNFVCDNTACSYPKIIINLQLEPINSAIHANPLHLEKLVLQQNWWNSITNTECSKCATKEIIHANSNLKQQRMIASLRKISGNLGQMLAPRN